MIPYREEMTKRHLKVTGDLGKIVFIVSVFLRRGILGVELDERADGWMLNIWGDVGV